MTVLRSHFRLGSKRIVTAYVVVGALSTISALSGLTLTRIQFVPTMTLSAAHAQVRNEGITSDASNDEISRYALSVLQIDGPRNEAYTEIKNILIEADLSGDRSDVALSCGSNRNISRNLARLPRNVRPDVRLIIVNFCNEAREIVENNGLTVRRFNHITGAHREDPRLADRIREEMLTLQDP